MKKFGLSAFVVFLFIAYSIHERGEAQENVHVIPPKPMQTTRSINSSNAVTPTPTSTGSPPENGAVTAAPKPQSSGIYKDGTYTGPVTDAFYGNIQVQAVIQGGKIVNVVFLQYPNDRSTSVMINQQAMPFLKQEAIQAQSAKVDIVSGATDSSQAFIQSLQQALSQAKG